MPYNNSKRTAGGAGTIRKKSFVSNGKEYTYWEARYTKGYDPGTGKQIQRTINGKSKKEVAERLREATANIDKGTYIDPCKMTLGEWLDIWVKEYLVGVKESTAYTYKVSIKNHIKPAMGAVRLDAVTPHMIQSFYNSKLETHSAKTIKNFHGKGQTFSEISFEASAGTKTHQKVAWEKEKEPKSEDFDSISLAAGEGFEPSQTESESGVLPLHKPAIVRSPLTISQAHYYYMQISEKVKKYF